VNIADVQTPPGRPPKLAAVREFKNDYFVNLLVMGSKWKAVPGFDGVFEGRGIRLRHDMKTARRSDSHTPVPGSSEAATKPSIP
jgi:catalase (peroxidase I)